MKSLYSDVIAGMMLIGMLIYIVILIAIAVIQHNIKVDKSTEKVNEKIVKLAKLANILFVAVAFSGFPIGLIAKTKTTESNVQKIEVPAVVAILDTANVPIGDDRVRCEVRVLENSDESYYVKEKTQLLWAFRETDVLYVGTQDNNYMAINDDYETLAQWR